MAAPAYTARSTPVGVPLEDGYQTLVTFLADPDVSFWEKAVTPPGMDGGDAINITTMHNVALRTFAAASLKTLTDGGLRVAYDPRVYPQILALINVHTTISIRFSDGTKLSFFGYLRTFEPDEVVEGQQPEATCSFSPTNTDGSGSEQNPVYGT